MRWISRIAAALIAATLQACATPPAVAPEPAASVAEARQPVTILVSIDAFRPDYLDHGVTPNLSRLAAEGAFGPMRPSFPTKTFPNHWTLVTGLRPDRNGIVGNRMEDAARPGELFTMESSDPFWWNEATPIWVDAEKAGIRTATMFWPGADVAIGGTQTKREGVQGGVRPSDWAQFNDAVTGTQRVNGVLDWLRRPAAIRPRFVTLYFSAVDHAGHDFGPGDPRTLKAVAEVDGQIGQLLAGLAELRQSANIVIVSDHGMAATSSDRVIDFSKLVPLADIHVVQWGTYVGLTPLPGHEASVEKALIGHHPHMDCWRKAELPARLHYGQNSRVPAILCLPESGWLANEKAPTERFARGEHGYDNAAPDMTATFIAHGPAFRPTRLAEFDNVDVYPLLRDLIGLPAKPGVDGTDAVFRGAMR